MSFIEKYLDHTKAYESPTSFWKWSAYTTIAAVLRDSVWIPDGDEKLFPNVYTLFLASSAQRKGKPITTSESLVTAINNIKIISGRASIQAILIEVGQTETDPNTGKVKKGGAAIFYAPELAAGIVTDDQSIQILTDIYDHKPLGHTTNLVGRGKSRLDSIVFSMFAASNEELLKDLYSSKAIYGGLLGRTFLVCADEFRPSNPFPSGNSAGIRELVKYLICVADLKGPFEFTPEAIQFYGEWYTSFRDKSRSKSDRAGVLGRLPTNVKKLSMLIAADRLSLVITKEDIETSIEETLRLLPNYNKMVMTTGKNTTTDAATEILSLIFAKEPKEMSRKDLVQKLLFEGVDHETVDKAMVNLETAGLTKCLRSFGTDVVYGLTEKCLEILRK